MKKCSHCQIEKSLEDFPRAKHMKLGRHSWCRECSYKAIREKREANPESFRKADNARYAANPIPKRIRTNAQRIANPEKTRIAKQAWKKTPQGKLAAQRYWAKHGETINAQSREEYASDPEAAKQSILAWKLANPEKEKARAARGNASRRMRLQQTSVNDLTAEQWKAILTTFKHCCAYCGKSERKLKKPLEQDHITALSKGGSHTVSNIVPACRSCNAKKNNGKVPTPVQPLLL